MKNTHGGVLLLVTLQTLLKITLLHGCFLCFLNCTNGTKSRNASHIKIGVPIFLLVDLIESFSTQSRKIWTARHSKSWINEIQNWWVNLYVPICFKYLSLLTLITNTLFVWFFYDTIHQAHYSILTLHSSITLMLIIKWKTTLTTVKFSVDITDLF